MSDSRTPTFPLAHSIRRKPRRLPLVLRFAKGAVHGAIIVPVILHSLFTVLIVYLDRYVGNVGLPSTIIPSLSIVVGLMLVFRNQTSYDRFWTGRNCLTTCVTSVRNLTRVFLVCGRGEHVPAAGGKATPVTEAEKMQTDKTVRALLATLYAIKHNLRNEFSFTCLPAPPSATSPHHGTTNGTARRRASSPSASAASLANTLVNSRHLQLHPHAPAENPLPASDATTAQNLDFTSLLPGNFGGFEDLGLGLPVQLTVLVETHIRRGYERGWWHAPLSSQLTVQLNALVDAYGKMETIRTTPLPVAHLIHQKQVLALFVCVLPFTTVDDFGWWAVPIVALVAFTLYGIEGIGRQLEDPFGYDKNDINMDGVIEDARQEVITLLEEWASDGMMFDE